MEHSSNYISAQNFNRIFSGSEFNVYCDESCHLEHSSSNAMALGAIWCPKQKTREINQRLIEIKKKHRIKPEAEVKWTKAAPGNRSLYVDFLDYFFDDDDLHFRGVVIPDKKKLDHARYGQTHDEWYYKMYFVLLKAIFRRDARYYVYIDIKDTHSSENARRLEDVCAANAHDFSHEIVRRVQPIRSDEVQIMQLVDILTGAICYRHNNPYITPQMNSTKVELVNRTITRSQINLTNTTLSSEDKLNLLVWEHDRR